MTSGAEKQARVLAHSPGRYPILIAELAPGEGPRALYHETAYDPEKTKPVTETWLRENAVGRHSFVALDPPRSMAPSEMQGFVRREILGEA